MIQLEPVGNGTSKYGAIEQTIWIVTTLFVFFLQAKTRGLLKKWLSSKREEIQGYCLLRQDCASSARCETTSVPVQKTFSYQDSLVNNFFDIDALPPVLTHYSSVIFKTAYTLQDNYGFQVASGRNQSEHLLMLLTNEKNITDGSDLLAPAIRLHTKMFINYNKWCVKVHGRSVLCRTVANHPDPELPG